MSERRWVQVLACALVPLLVGCTSPRPQEPARYQLNGPGPVPSPTEDPPEPVKLAFVGDVGIKKNSRAVLNLIKAEGAQAVVHQGDFDYKSDPDRWEAQINSILGADYPYFASVGNHDEDRFYGEGGYQDYMQQRLERLKIPWSGELGVQSTLSYAGITLVFTAPDVFGKGHAAYIREQLAADTAPWRICSWHKNMTAMQVGGKGNDTGWGVYEEARRAGAIIATGHEHSYSRTHLLKSCKQQKVEDAGETLVLARDDPKTPEDEGRTFAFVNGLGGNSIRDQERDGDHWACIYTEDQNAASGALFGVFNYGGDPLLARFYFKDIKGRIVDEFFVRSGGQSD